MLYKQGEGFGERETCNMGMMGGPRDKRIDDDPGEEPVGWGQDGCRSEESGGLSSPFWSLPLLLWHLLPVVRRRLFLSAEASYATPGVCVCVHQFLYGFPLQYEMNLKILIIIRQTSIMLPFSMGWINIWVRWSVNVYNSSLIRT